MKIPKWRPGPCPACDGRLVPVPLIGFDRRAGESHSPLVAHFRCTECAVVFSMAENFDLTECECPREHVELPAPARNLDADAAEVRNRYFPLSRSPRSKVPA